MRAVEGTKRRRQDRLPRGVPRSLSIGLVVYRIRWLEGRMFLNGERAMSIVDTERRTISIQRCLSGERMRESLGRIVDKILRTDFHYRAAGEGGVLCGA